MSRVGVLGLVALPLAACVSLCPVAPVVDGPDGVRVLLAAQDGGRLRIEVANYGARPLEIDGDRLVLVTPEGPRPPRLGDGAAVSTVAPGGRGALEVRFALRGLRVGERVALSLAGAVRADGRPLPLAPLEFVAD